MALPLRRTLGDIRADIQVRLGFGQAGQSGVVNAPLIDSMIRSAQNQLYHQHEFLRLKKTEEQPTGAEQQFYDYPTDCDIEGIIEISVKWGNRYHELTEGIDLSDRGWNPAGPPQKYERAEQIELWPIPASTEYTLRIEYIQTLEPLTDTHHRTTIDSELVFLHALSNAKAHYRQPDAQTYASQLEALLNKMRAKNRSRQVWGKTHRVGPYDYVDGSQDV
jgi:hypothetical protein